LLLTDIFQVAFPYWESQASVQAGLRSLARQGVSASQLPPSLLVPEHLGGLQLLGQPAFLVLVAGHLIVASAVLGRLRRTALAVLVVSAAADATQWNFANVVRPGAGTGAVLTIAVFLLEAVALAAADPRAARRREGWQHVFPALVLAVAAQVRALAFDASRIPVSGGDLRPPAVDTLMVIGLVLTALAVLLPPLQVLAWAVTQAVRTGRAPARGDLAA
jgi:hypothetical protein